MRQSPEALSSLLPKLHAKVFQAPHPPEDTRSSSVVSPPQASSSEANRSVSLSQDEMDEIERMEEWDDDEANEEMKIVLRASKRSAILEDEERRRAAWAALDMPVPGSSSQGAAKEGASSAKVAPSSAPAHSAKEESLKRKAETSAKKPAGAQPGTGTDKR